MESIQQQISTLTHKVDRVYQMIDRLNQHVFEQLDSSLASGEETAIRHPNREDFQPASGDPRRLPYRRQGYANLPIGKYRQPTEWVIAQQDVLIDSSGVEISHHQIKEQDLAPQVQIQRLTAQLTAAYNRIAALEEQLLANHWK